MLLPDMQFNKDMKMTNDIQPNREPSAGGSSKPHVAGSAVRFRIHGRARKELKKKVGFLKGYVRHFWHFEDCNRVNGLWLDDAECQRRIDNANAEIEYLEKQLNETL